MAEGKSSENGSPPDPDAVRNLHQALLQALRYREQDIIRYLAILIPALGGFWWLLDSGKDNTTAFFTGTIAVLLLLLLGAAYASALAYNYRVLLFEITKLEDHFKMRDVLPKAWPEFCPKNFLDRNKLWGMSWCSFPEVIKVFWLGFIIVIIYVLVAVCFTRPTPLVAGTIIRTGIICVLVSLYLPHYFGKKLHDIIAKEDQDKTKTPEV